MSSLTQYFGGGSGIGTVYTYQGNFTKFLANSYYIQHDHNLNITTGYEITAWMGQNTPRSTPQSIFNINTASSTGVSSENTRVFPITAAVWNTNNCQLYEVQVNQIGSIQIIY